MSTSSKRTTFWRASPAMSRQILAELANRKQFSVACRKLAARFPGTDRKNFYIRTRPGGTRELTGLIFTDPNAVDHRLFKALRLPASQNGWAPRRTSAASRALAKEFAQTTCEVVPRILQLLGLDWFFGTGYGTPGITPVGAIVYLEVSGASRKQPKGCQRISDLAYERATRPKPARAKAKAKPKTKQTPLKGGRRGH